MQKLYIIVNPETRAQYKRVYPSYIKAKLDRDEAILCYAITTSFKIYRLLAEADRKPAGPSARDYTGHFPEITVKVNALLRKEAEACADECDAEKE